MAALIDLPFGLWTRRGLKEAPVQSYSPGGAVSRISISKQHAISGFPVLQGSAEPLHRWIGKTKHRMISYFLSNTSAKNYHNRVDYSKSKVFLRHSVYWYDCTCFVKCCVFIGCWWTVSWFFGHTVSGTAVCTATVPTVGISQGDYIYIYVHVLFHFFSSTLLYEESDICKINHFRSSVNDVTRAGRHEHTKNIPYMVLVRPSPFQQLQHPKPQALL